MQLLKSLLFALFALLSLVHLSPLAPLRITKSGTPIKSQYIVVLKAQPSFQSAEATHKAWLINLLAQSSESRLLHFYDTIRSYSVRATENIITEIRKRPEVDFVEQDHLVRISRVTPAPKLPTWLTKKPKRMHPNATNSKKKLSTLVQSNAPWGLSRISKTRTASTQESNDYIYPSSAGKGVNVYVIDTGIHLKHKELQGRASWGITIPKYDFDVDANGHGTHCAGVIAGKTYGVAKQAHVIAVKVLRSNGYGTNSDVLKGVEWVAIQHQMSRGLAKSIASMSLGGSKSYALDLMVDAAIGAGVSFAVAAGNDFEDACEYSPAACNKAVTVGAMDPSDGMAYFSNWGPCVDVFAPGVGILSAWIGSRSAYQVLSGTSMAAPHVAGVMALLLGEGDYSPAEVKDILLKHSLQGYLNGVPEGTGNNLLSIIDLIQEE